MSGGGGGSSGQVSYPEYLQTFHRDLLNNGESEFLTFSLVDAMNSAHNASPYTGVTVVDPTGYTTVVQDREEEYGLAVAGFDNIADYQAAHAAAIALYTLDTSPPEHNETDTSTLQSNTTDVATLDTTSLNSVVKDAAPTKDAASAAIAYTSTAVTALTPDTAITYTPTTITIDPVTADSMPVDETAIADDVATYAAILREQIENDVLPRFKAGMLNVNAVTSSAFVIGEALIWAAYDRDVARYAADLHSKVFLQNGQYNSAFLLAASQQNAQFKITEGEHESKSLLQTQNLNAGENLARREQSTRYGLSASEQTNLRVVEAQRLTAAENLAVREESSRYNTTFREENRSYVLAASEQNSRFKLANSGETKDLKLAFSDQTTRFKLSSQETNTRLKLAFSEENTRFKLASSDQNTKYKIQKNELDASHKLNRQKNVLLATAEMVRLLTTKIEFVKAALDTSYKTAAFLITSQNEEIHEQLVIDEADAKWNIELFQYAANLIASVSGGTNPNVKKQSKAVSALGGALSGAAMGAAVGGPVAPYTAAAGAVIGGVAGYLQ